MTDEGKANLLRAYRMSIEAGQDTIADILEDVIVSEMDDVRSITVGSPNTTINPPWNVTGEPLGARGTWVGTDPLTHTTTAGAIE